MKPVVRRFLQIGVLIVVQALALFLAAGKLNWAEGWVYLGLYLGLIGLNAVLILPKGDMSLIGPRPERDYFIKQLCEKIPYYNVRHSIKPGITGWAQVRYPYGATDDDAMHKLQYDLYYVKNHSLFLDLMILFQTAQVVLWGKGVR